MPNWCAKAYAGRQLIRMLVHPGLLGGQSHAIRTTIERRQLQWMLSPM